MTRQPTISLFMTEETSRLAMQQLRSPFPTVTREWAMPEPPKHPSGEYPVIDNIFSPKTLDEYVGQSEAKELARIMIHAAKKDGRSLPNTLVVGEYGLGKTTLARLIMQEYGGRVSILDGASVNRQIPSGEVIIDEIHNLNPEVADTLNLSLDNERLHIIGCTTDPGKLPSAFRSRFRIFYLSPYTVDELTLLLDEVVRRKGVSASRLTLQAIADRSRSNARQATLYLSFIFDLATVKGQKTITPAIVSEAFKKLGVDRHGFAERDRLYLASLPEDRPVGLQYLSAMTGIDSTTLEEEIEPYLLRKGMIDRTQRGRMKIKDLEEVYHGVAYRE